MWKTIGAYFWDCERTNPDYPYGITTENTGILWTTKSENKFVRVPLVWEITYYVINSSAEWKELCKNYSVSFDIENYVDFSTQTILGFVVSNPFARVGGCGDNDLVYIYILKGMENGTIYAGWGVRPDWIYNCLAIIYPPYYGAVATNRKISSQSSFVIRNTLNPKTITLEDFCPYMP
jgi:hypothetical protein